MGGDSLNYRWPNGKCKAEAPGAPKGQRCPPAPQARGEGAAGGHSSRAAAARSKDTNRNNSALSSSVSAG
ncbi:MAG: hypothetical protein J6333_07850, partial [Planctomycetes bacterium]|nr:hypothetical protein [Planctomycetota bacterium]